MTASATEGVLFFILKKTLNKVTQVEINRVHKFLAFENTCSMLSGIFKFLLCTQ